MHVWCNGSAYLDGDWVEMDASRARKYDVYSQKDIVFDFAAIERPSDIPPFVRRYGLLWHGPGSDTFRELTEDWLVEAETLRVALTLYATQAKALAGNRKYLDKLRASRIHLGFQERAETDEQLYQQTSALIARLIDQKLTGVQMGIKAACEFERPDKPGEAQPPGVFVLTAFSPTLIAHIYYGAAMMIVNRVPASNCVQCGRMFIVRDGRQKYCSPTCGANARYHRFVAKRETKQEGIDNGTR